ncbi:hypothetical protein OG799_33050 [Micromonospora sp. NBC_00898]|uniref:hypothetical protein n=1 Tax=Micromonospora sp. NBC_00898 TaxID=2975981 RepID=UPI00386B03BA|nr:hypothetical protein OG799_33050 [Micromonospora sp. NBC_00898]
MRIRRWVVVVTVVGLLGGCDGAPAPGGASRTGSTDATDTGPASGSAAPAPSCPADNRYGEVMAAGGEVAGTPGVFWALLFLQGARLPAGGPVKIALRVTGSGELTLTAVGPGGVTVEPESFDSHDGSTWVRPGDEWGSYWVFPTAGCWTLRAERTDGTRGALTLRAG